MKYRVLHYDVVDSTNNVAKQLASLGAANGTVVVANYQTAGRGRFKRKWRSPKGKDLLFSIILRPKKMRTNQAPLLTQLAAMSVRDCLNGCVTLNASLKMIVSFL